MATTKSADDQSSWSSGKSSKYITQKATDGFKKLKQKASKLLGPKKKKASPSAGGRSLIAQNLTMKLALHSPSSEGKEAKPKAAVIDIIDNEDDDNTTNVEQATEDSNAEKHDFNSGFYDPSELLLCVCAPKQVISVCGLVVKHTVFEICNSKSPS